MYSEQAKHIAVICVLVIFLLVHVKAAPYAEVREDETTRSTAFVGIIPWLRPENRCNNLETALLTNMIFICLVSFSALATASDISDARWAVLGILLLWPTALFIILLIHKFIFLVHHRYKGRKPQNMNVHPINDANSNRNRNRQAAAHANLAGRQREEADSRRRRAYTPLPPDPASVPQSNANVAAAGADETTALLP